MNGEVTNWIIKLYEKTIDSIFDLLAFWQCFSLFALGSWSEILFFRLLRSYWSLQACFYSSNGLRRATPTSAIPCYM